jgi:hypothetical protein
MTEKKVTVGKLMAAASVLGLSLGMTAQAADTNQHKGESTQIKGESTQIKGESNQGKWTGFLKHRTDHKISTQHKIEGAGSSQLKWDAAGSNQHKLGTGDSTQIKLDGVDSSQHKHDTPSTELNPQPEPPMQQGTQGNTPH